MALRRTFATQKRNTKKDVWPIDSTACNVAENWRGWPEGKKFAFVLTHDVESLSGLEKCRAIMDIEREMGFRSCFNLIPEGSYEVPAELRAEMVSGRFEVGVHDLRHDGRLFANRTKFQENAARINNYLSHWNATGFRSGFMLRNLDWLHDLAIVYDCSTFDTDPFELQSDGAGTIFPFWISSPLGAAYNGNEAVTKKDVFFSAAKSRGGYVELPYTLSQDSTLFLVLREPSPAVWIRKLDWIADHGGMALINVHPDYICLDGEPLSPRTFPVAHYRKFLTYLIHRYKGTFWHSLPSEIATYATQYKPSRAARHKRVCMITHSSYESDNRVTRYAEALADRGDQVDVIALARSPKLARKEILRGVNLYRIQNRFGKRSHSKSAYFWPWLRFFLKSFWWVSIKHYKTNFDILHVHNMPDFLAFAAWYPKFTGAKIILDIHDIVPEFYSSKFGLKATSKTELLLKWIERISARFAHHVIVSNHLWFEKYAKRTSTENMCSVFINNVDTHIFRPRPRTRNDNKLIVLFPGGLQWHQGLDIAILAFGKIVQQLPNAEFQIYGDGNMKSALINLTHKLGLDENIHFFDPVRVTDIAQVIANSDIGLVPKRADSFGNEAYSTKIMEFMSTGIPVVVSRTKIDQYYFDDSVVRFFESGNITELVIAVIETLTSPERRERLITNAAVYSSRHSWEQRKSHYLKIVDDLIRYGKAKAQLAI